MSEPAAPIRHNLDHPRQVPLAELVQHPENARRGNVPALAQSLQLNGQYKSIVVQASTRYVLAGNHTVQAAELLGWTHLSAVLLDVDDTAARRILLADNRVGDLGGYDDELLTQLLQGAGDLTGTGYDQADLDGLLALLDATAPDWAGSDQDAADAQEQASLPVIKLQVSREVFAAWRAVPADSDTGRLEHLLALHAAAG